MYCKYCGNEINPRFSLPNKCKRCKHEFDWKPSWIPNVILIVSLLPPPILAGLLHSLGWTWTLAGFAMGFVLTFVLFNLLEVAAWKRGWLKSDLASEHPVPVREHVKKPLAELGYATRAQVELAQVAMPDTTKRAVSDTLARPATPSPEPPTPNPNPAAPAKPKPQRCRFEHIRAGQTQKIEDLSRLATSIVREHFDPIIGKEQNDYMLARYQTPEAIAKQLDEGYEYSFVCPPGTTGKEPPESRRIGFLAFRQESPDVLYLSKFYLRADQRGRGYSHDMLEFVCREAAKRGCSRITLNVNRNNYQAILAYEHLGFKKVREERNGIGGGFYMDDFVYELDL